MAVHTSSRNHPVQRVFATVLGDDPPFRVTGYDGSVLGSQQSPLAVHVTGPDALSYLLTAPGDLGLGRAYLSGALQVEGVHPGDPYAVLAALKRVEVHRPSVRDAAALVADLGPGMFHRPPVPAREAPPRWKRTLMTRLPAGARSRAARSIRYHYDVGNAFYELILGPSMTYSCAVFTPSDDDLARAQERKYALIADKLDLQPGQRLLDIGCGWGGMVRHAARERGVRALGVTLSVEQAQWARQRVEAEGLSDLVEVRLQDYRDVAEGDFDAICSIGMAEHVGARRLAGYFAFIHDHLRVGGRLLNHCITRADSSAASAPEPFIDRYVFPNGELVPTGRIVGQIDDSGLEVDHVENLRMHYAHTLRHWSANLRDNWDAAVATVGEQTAKVWGLYMAGSRFSFESNWLHLSQALAIKPRPDGSTTYPLRSHWGA